MANPKRSLPVAYIGGVLIVIAIYVLIAIVVVGHLSFGEVARGSDHVLSVAAESFMGRTGYLVIVVAALLATSSAIRTMTNTVPAAQKSGRYAWEFLFSESGAALKRVTP